MTIQFEYAKREEMIVELKAYKEKHGRFWKDRLYQAWEKDYPEQWGVLRQIRNSCPELVKEV